jgi:hypothetical protein
MAFLHDLKKRDSNAVSVGRFRRAMAVPHLPGAKVTDKGGKRGHSRIRNRPLNRKTFLSFVLATEIANERKIPVVLVDMCPDLEPKDRGGSDIVDLEGYNKRRIDHRL